MYFPEHGPPALLTIGDMLANHKPPTQCGATFHVLRFHAVIPDHGYVCTQFCPLVLRSVENLLYPSSSVKQTPRTPTRAPPKRHRKNREPLPAQYCFHSVNTFWPCDANAPCCCRSGLKTGCRNHLHWPVRFAHPLAVNSSPKGDDSTPARASALECNPIPPFLTGRPTGLTSIRGNIAHRPSSITRPPRVSNAELFHSDQSDAR